MNPYDARAMSGRAPRQLPRPARTALRALAAAALAAGAAACGEQDISVPHNSPYYTGAVIFQEHCSGCHTLAAAGAHGSPQNITNSTALSGPNFDQRCEKPAIRVLYAIENGGYEGAYMPQNIVVGKQAREVAEFVSHYAGSQAVYQPGSGAPKCSSLQSGSLPALPSVAGTGTSTTATTASGP
jgi:mono/diheme cytochrome c family protein